MWQQTLVTESQSKLQYDPTSRKFFNKFIFSFHIVIVETRFAYAAR